MYLGPVEARSESGAPSPLVNCGCLLPNEYPRHTLGRVTDATNLNLKSHHQAASILPN